MFLPKKIPKSKILNPQKSFDPGHLKSTVTHPPRTRATKSSKIYYLLWTWRIKMVDKWFLYCKRVENTN